MVSSSWVSSVDPVVFINFPLLNKEIILELLLWWFFKKKKTPVVVLVQYFQKLVVAKAHGTPSVCVIYLVVLSDMQQV